MKVSTSFEVPIAESPCVGCGQCAAVCPTGAIVVKNDTAEVWRALDDAGCKVTVQIAPAVRVALGQAFGLDSGASSMGTIVAALRRMGFDEIYDTATGADLTVLEESGELMRRLEGEAREMPLFSSCCPAWVSFCEKFYPELMANVSTCRSPMQMFAALIKEQGRTSKRRQVHVAVMPCTAKKYEARREEFRANGDRTLFLRAEADKTESARYIQMNNVACGVFRHWREQSKATKPGDLVFPSPNSGKKIDNCDSAWRSLLKAAEIENFRWHDMRHDFASQLVMRGIDLNTVRELLGHADMKMTLRYAHLAPAGKRKAVEVLEEMDAAQGISP